MRIIWYSRHALTTRQREALLVRWPGAQIAARSSWSARPDESLDEIVREARAGAEIAIVAPLSVVARLCDAGVRPLWAEMEQLPAGDPRAEVQARGRSYRFVRWRRVVRLQLEFEEV